MATSAANVIDVTEQSFGREVIEKSYNVPVVVDFWAAWCGPCRMLGPVLEKLAAEYEGGFILAKLDVDQSPNLSRQFQVQGIPAVKAFRDGRVVNEFTGALPEPQVRQFLETLVPSEVDLLAEEGYRLEMESEPELAAEKYQAALAKQADHYGAMLGLGRVLLRNDQAEEGTAILERIPSGLPEYTEAAALLATAQFQQYATDESEADLRAKIEANANDLESRYALANLLAAKGEFAQAMEAFLEVIRRNRSYDDDGARKALLALFNIVGDNDPLTRSYRQKLANALF
jgi:putative thioredoxin